MNLATDCQCLPTDLLAPIAVNHLSGLAGGLLFAVLRTRYELTSFLQSAKRSLSLAVRMDMTPTPTLHPPPALCAYDKFLDTSIFLPRWIAEGESADLLLLILSIKGTSTRSFAGISLFLAVDLPLGISTAIR
jgi:hypothetical protein